MTPRELVALQSSLIANQTASLPLTTLSDGCKLTATAGVCPGYLQKTWLVAWIGDYPTILVPGHCMNAVWKDTIFQALLQATGPVEKALRAAYAIVTKLEREKSLASV
jgi:hypothetical protein